MLVDYIWYFFIYAVLGWCAEVIFAAVNTGKFVNRGFLNGPLCPMYGVGVAVIVFCLSPLEDNVWLTFLAAVVLTSGLEWITGFVLEKLFHQRWWDYSGLPFNIGGYICLKFSLAWGLACLLILKVIHPGIAALVHHIPFHAQLHPASYLWRTADLRSGLYRDLRPEPERSSGTAQQGYFHDPRRIG